MSFRIEITSYFKKQAKHLLKKYPSLKQELNELVESLVVSPIQGAPIGNNCYKIRISIASKNKGKSGGGRVIIHIHFLQEHVYMLAIYDKSAQESISEIELAELLKHIQ